MSWPVTVWVVITHEEWGGSTSIQGVYATKDHAEAALRADGWATVPDESRPTWGRDHHAVDNSFSEYANIESYPVESP